MSLEIPTIFSVLGKVVLITGGGTGIGRMLAEGFVTNGATVYVTGRRGDVLARAVDEINGLTKGQGRGRAHALQGDVSTKAGAMSLRTALMERETHLDVLINNAGTLKPWRVKVSDHNDPDQIEKLLWDGVDEIARTGLTLIESPFFNALVNVNGVFFMTAAMVPLLRKSSLPSVINISSYAGTANQRTVSALTYGVSKAGTNHLSTMLAGRLAPLGIRVNTIMPGAFPSEITSSTDPTSGTVTLHSAAHKAALRSPLGRAGLAREIVGPAILLASDAGGFMDNACFTVDGGRQMCAGMNDGIRMPEETYP